MDASLVLLVGQQEKYFKNKFQNRFSFIHGYCNLISSYCSEHCHNQVIY
uniref:Uncharacterized protein n=1 Tax=Arundo donax TaxID=35708 RepID=A0A0A9AB87_ARUDO